MRKGEGLVVLLLTKHTNKQQTSAECADGGGCEGLTWKIKTRIEIALDEREANEHPGLVLVPHGLCAVMRSDGSLIEGAFAMGVPHGFARVQSAVRGIDIQGCWDRGRLHGRASAMTSDGWIVCATWNQGHMRGDYIAQSQYGEQFRCASAARSSFDGAARRSFGGGDHVIERWRQGQLIDIERYRIAPVLVRQHAGDMAGHTPVRTESVRTRLERGVVIEDCRWTCQWLSDGYGNGGYAYYPEDVTGDAFALLYEYVTWTAASERAMTVRRRDMLARAMWGAYMCAMSTRMLCCDVVVSNQPDLSTDDTESEDEDRDGGVSC